MLNDGLVIGKRVFLGKWDKVFDIRFVCAEQTQVEQETGIDE